MHAAVEAYQVNAFANQDGATGSPTGVVLHADPLDSDTMLVIARSLNASHTAFLSEPRRSDCAFAIRFFTPNGELRNCAHATIAAHCLRATMSGIDVDQPTRQETVAGVQEVWTKELDRGLIVSFKQNEIVQQDAAANVVQRLVRGLACTRSALHACYPVRLMSPGSFRFMVPLKSIDDVIALRPKFVEIDQLCREMQSIGCFVFCLNEVDDQYEAHGRMFAPTIGVEEDAVNGNSAGCLGAYLMELPDGSRFGSRLQLRVLQGSCLGRPSVVDVEARRVDGRIETFVGGTAEVVGAREVIV